jgi:beta-galactosidase
MMSEQRGIHGNHEAAQPRYELDFDFGWKFLLNDETQALAVDYDDGDWHQLDLPHDWSIEHTPYAESGGGVANGFYDGGVGWYRKSFVAPAWWQKRNILIESDGIYHRSDVYVNGELVGHRPYGYVSFAYDITRHLHAGRRNVIAIRVDHSDAPTSRWYSGSGIYRHTRLIVTQPVRVAHWSLTKQ